MPSQFKSVAQTQVEYLKKGDIIRFVNPGGWVDGEGDALGGWLMVDHEPIVVGNGDNGRRIKVTDGSGATAIAERRRWAVVDVILP